MFFVPATDVDHMSPEVSAIQGQRKRHLAGEDSMMFAEPTPPSRKYQTIDMHIVIILTFLRYTKTEL